MIFYLNIWCLCASEISNGIDPGAQAHGTHAICIHLSCWISMFGRVKSGTINASQLFFQGSHRFYIFTLRIHACNKNKITIHSTAGSENIWQLCCQNLFHTAIAISKTNVGSSTKSLKNKSSEHFETTWCLLLSISFLLPEFQEAHPITKVDP